jgi:hypothetical protein
MPQAGAFQPHTDGGLGALWRRAGLARARRSGAPISGLNEAVRTFRSNLQHDELARRRVEFAVVTFGGTVRVLQPFVSVERLARNRKKPGSALPDAHQSHSMGGFGFCPFNSSLIAS